MEGIGGGKKRIGSAVAIKPFECVGIAAVFGELHDDWGASRDGFGSKEALRVNGGINYDVCIVDSGVCDDSAGAMGVVEGVKGDGKMA